MCWGEGAGDGGVAPFGNGVGWSVKGFGTRAAGLDLRYEGWNGSVAGDGTAGWGSERCLRC